MMTKTLDCVECGASAPYGRLSCPSCGSLLASVTGGRRPAVRITQVESQPEPDPAPEPVTAAASVAVATAPVNPVKTAAARKRAPVPPPFLDAADVPAPAAILAEGPTPAAAPARTPSYAPTPAARARSAAPTPAPTPALVASAPNPVPTAAPKPAPSTATEPPVPIPSAVGTASRTPSYAPTPAAAARARTSAPGPARAEAARAEAQRAAIVPLLEPSAIASLPPTPWAPIAEPAPMLSGRPYQRHLTFELDPVEVAPPPSAYRPPSQAMVMATATAAANEAARAHPSTDGSGTVAAEAPAAKDATWWLNTIPDPARFVEIAGWFIVVGSTMSLLGFLLPWSRVVIGASTIGGYFDGWGLASPTHLFVFIGLLALLALAIRRKPVPAWISSGILGLVFGGLLLGLAWPYLVGPLGADVGLTMTTLGGMTLLIGGVVALWATRHVGDEPLV